MGYRYDCSKCEDRCDGKSLGIYNFKNDVEYSEHFENEIIEKLCVKNIMLKRQKKMDIQILKYITLKMETLNAILK